VRVWLGAWALILTTAGMAAHGTDRPTPDERMVIVYGKADGAASGWAINTIRPAGWTSDCCQYARAIGVNLVMYRGDWTGEPDRVIVLNVWPRKLPTLEAEWQDDRKHYLQVDPAGKFEAFSVMPDPKKGMTCSGGIYHGTDRVDDVVVFCDPGKATGIHLSWSMTLASTGADRAQVLDQFRQVVEQSFYMKYVGGPEQTGKAKR